MPWQPRSGTFSRRRAAVLSLVDQGTSSLTNFGILFAAARVLDRTDFGWFSIAYALYVIFLGVAQSWVGQELVLPSETGMAQADRIRSAVAFTVCIGLASSLIVGVGTLLLLDGQGQRTLLTMTALLPVLLVQEVLRYCASSIRRPDVALLADVVWLTGMAAALVAVAAWTPLTPTLLMLAWGCAGGASLLVFRLRGVAPPWRIPTSRPWTSSYARRHHLAHRFLTEYLLVRGVGQLATLSIGWLAGAVAAGAVRGAATLFGPVNIAFNAINAFAAPITHGLSPRRQVQALASIGAALATFCALLAVVLLNLPNAYGEAVLGDTWDTAQTYFAPVAVQFAAMAFGITGYLGIRLCSPRSTLRLKVWASGILALLFFGGYGVAGVEGAIWGQAAASVIQAGVAWTGYLRRVRRL